MPNPIHKYTITTVQDLDAVKRMVDDLADAGTFAFDFETRSEDFDRYPEGALRKMTMEADLCSFATADQRAWVAPLGMVTMQNAPADKFFSTVKPLMEDTGILKLAWNFSYDAAVFANYDVWVACYEDVMIKAHTLDENAGAGLKTRCADGGMELTPYDFKTYWRMRHAFLKKDIDKKGNEKVRYADLQPLEARYVEYSAEDSIATIVLNPIYDLELAKYPKLKELYHRLLNPAVRTVFNMERRGVPIDRVYFNIISSTCKHDADIAEKQVYKAAQQHFNIGSTKDLGRVLYQELGLPVFKTTEKGSNSTDADSLQKLAQAGYTIAEDILRFRHLGKLYNTYLDPDAGLAKHMYDWGSIHPSFNLTGTSTGRLSSSSPNAQQIPRSSAKTYFIRKGFVPHSGYRLVGGDQSQVELRMMAHFSGDAAMCAEYRKDEALWKALNNRADKETIKALSKVKSDIHQKTADACKCKRNPTAKNINFGLLYGMMARSLAGVLTSVNFVNALENGLPFDPLCDVVPPELAQEFYDLFFNTYPGIKAYQEFIGEKAKRQGYIETRWGRRRRLPDIESGDRWLVMGAQRQAVNVTIQGHVGEMMLLSMCKAENIIHNPDGEALRKLGFRLFLQVHDEVMGECPDNDQVCEDVKFHLTNIFQNPGPSTDAYPYSSYRVPLIFEAQSGMTWDGVH
jgi:DNA polymerase-1